MAKKKNIPCLTLYRVEFNPVLQAYEFSFLVPNIEIEHLCNNGLAFEQLIRQFKDLLEAVNDTPHLTDLNNINLN